MNLDFERDELIRFADRLTTGTIEPAELERLESLLQDDPEARRLYWAFMDLDMGLRDMAAGGAAQTPPAVGLGLTSRARQCEERAGPFGRWFSYTATAAFAALATAVMLLFLLRQSQESGETQLNSRPKPPTSQRVLSHESPDPVFVATLLFADQCHWEMGDARPVEGQRLSVGELHLAAGLALLRFDGGAIAVIADDTKVTLESRGSVRLHYGRLTARASDEAVGFTVRTPARTVVDLGTEFVVEVERSGATEVHVLDGAVEFRDPARKAGSGQLLRSGHAVRFDEGHAMKPTPVAIRAKPLDQILSEAKPKPREDLLVVYEGFQYDVGTIPLADASGGWGWQGPWRGRRAGERNDREAASAEEMQVAFQKLQVPWPIRGGRAGMLEMAPGNKFLVRPLETPVDLAKDHVYYLSIMMREDVDAKKATTNCNESARLTLRSTGDYWGDRVCFGLPKHRTPHIELADFIRFTGPQVSGGRTMIWVAKIAAQRRGEDEIFFRVYQEGESLDIFEPADWSITSRGIRSDAKLDLLLLSSTGETRRWFDEVRIGTSWRAVVPIAQPTTVARQQESSAKPDRENSIEREQ